ncbi:MAG: hypothetical protein M5U28_34130 [Sandaracinaceae bacterium]|nr:hypothetical protein [Sandaracinaceae bacterium]
MSTTHTSAAALAVVLVACAGSPDPVREDITAEEHEREAEEEEREAAEHDAQYDPDARTAGGQEAAARFGIGVYNPTEGHRAAAEEHRAHAEAHRRRAEQLRAFEQAECAEFPAETRAACPLLIGVERVEDVPGGAAITFAEDVDLTPVVDHIRCHLAFAAAEGLEGMEECGLYVLGARVELRERTIVLTTTERRQVAELRRRVRAQLR